MELFGRNYTKQQILAYAGNTMQLFGIMRKRFAEGNGDGAKTFELKTGGGLECTVLESRCMDIYSMTYKGIPIQFLSKNGLFNPLRTLPAGANETLQHLTGGLEPANCHCEGRVRERFIRRCEILNLSKKL